MTIHIPSGSGGYVARFPIGSAVAPEREFLTLLDQRERITERLEVLLEHLLEAEMQQMTAERAALPLSGLVQAQPGVLLFKGGPNA